MLKNKKRSHSKLILGQSGHGHFLLFFFIVMGLVGIVGYRVYSTNNSVEIPLLSNLSADNDEAVLGVSSLTEKGGGSTGGGGVPKLTTRVNSRTPSNNTVTPALESTVGSQKIYQVTEYQAERLWPKTFPPDWVERYSPNGVKKSVSESNGKTTFNPPGLPVSDAGARSGSGGVIYRNGAGSRGKSGGKIVGKLVALGAGTLILKNLLEDGKQQQESKYYEFGDRSYGVHVYGLPGKGGGDVKLVPGVSVTIRVHAMQSLGGGCNNIGQVTSIRPVVRVTNTNGSAFFQHCTNQQIDLSITDIPPEYRGGVAKQAGGGYAKVDTKEGDNAMSISVYLKPKSDSTTKTRTSTQTAPGTDTSKGTEEECLANEQAGNNERVTGSHGSKGGTIDQRAPDPWDSGFYIRLKDILKTNSVEPRGKLTDKCDQARHSRDYSVIVKGSTLASGKKQPIAGLNVQLEFNGPGKCLGVGNRRPDTTPTSQTNAEGVAGFNNCGRNNINIKLTDLKGYNKVVSTNGQSLGAKVKAKTSKKGQRVVIEIELMKPYPDDWRRQFDRAASHYWGSRHHNGIPAIDSAAVSRQIVNFHSATCRPSDVLLTSFTDDHGMKDVGKGRVFANAAMGGGISGDYSDLGATTTKGDSRCTIMINDHKNVRKATGNKVLACLIFSHEYGHFLGYPDFLEAKNGITTGDLMYNHLRHTFANQKGAEFKRLVSDTGCGAVFKGTGFANYIGAGVAVGGGDQKNNKSKKPILVKYPSATKRKFALATTQYWRRAQAKYNGESSQLKMDTEAKKCTPSKVKVKYKQFGDPDQAPVGSAFYNNVARAKLGGAAHRDCVITFNSNQYAFLFTGNDKYACVLFMHAYGRLLGYDSPEHSPNLTDAEWQRYLMYPIATPALVDSLAQRTECGSYFTGIPKNKR